MLKITIQESDKAIGITLVGRLAGPYAAELDRVWVEQISQASHKKLSLDLRDLTYADAEGKRVLSEICAQTNAECVTSTPWTHHLAEEITRTKVNRSHEEA